MQPPCELRLERVLVCLVIQGAMTESASLGFWSVHIPQCPAAPGSLEEPRDLLRGIGEP